MNIVEHIYEQTERFPEKPAIISAEGVTTFEQLRNKVDSKATYFVQKGIQKGDRVLLFSPMNVNLYASLLALFKLGAVAVIVDKWASIHRIRTSIRQSNCKAILASGKLKYLSYLWKETRSIPIHLSLKKEVGKNTGKFADLDTDHPALITFTTGSSNQPKAAIRTHGFLNVQFETIIESKGTVPEDVELIHLPILLMINLASGCTSYIPGLHKKQFQKSNWKKIEQEIKRYDVNTITCSPAFLAVLCDQTNGNDSVKKIFCGGGTVVPELAQKTIRQFPNSASFVVYGATEAEPISIGTFEQLSKADIIKDDGLFVGEPHKSLELLIHQPKTGENIEFGEILVKGPHVLDHYLNEEGESSNKIEIDGKQWHRTGDLGFLKNGELYFNGRVHQLITNESIPPLVISAMIKEITGSSGVIIQVGDRKILCVESNVNHFLDELKKKLTFDEVRVFKKLPRDPRHQTKVDYRKLVVQCSV